MRTLVASTGRASGRTEDGEELFERRLGKLVDGERDIAAGAVARLRAPGVGPELGQHHLTQPLRELEHQLRTGDGWIARRTHARALCTHTTAIIAA